MEEMIREAYNARLKKVADFAELHKQCEYSSSNLNLKNQGVDGNEEDELPMTFGERALFEIVKSSVLIPRTANSYLMRGQNYLMLGDFSSAKNNFLKCLRLEGNLDENMKKEAKNGICALHLISAHLLYNANQFRACLRQLSIAKEYGPNCRDVYYRKFLCFLKLVDIEKALSCLNDCVTMIESTRPKLKVANASSIEDSKNYEKKEESLEIQIESLTIFDPLLFLKTSERQRDTKLNIDGFDAEIILIRSRFLKLLNRHMDAIRDVHKVIVMFPSNAKLISNSAEFRNLLAEGKKTLRREAISFALEGSIEKSLEKIMTSLFFFPDDVEMEILRICLFRTNGNIKLANQEISKLLQRFPDDKRVQYHAALTFNDLAIEDFKKKKYDSALSLLTKAIETIPKPKFFIHRADIYILQDKDGLAMRDLDQALILLNFNDIRSKVMIEDDYNSNEIANLLTIKNSNNVRTSATTPKITDKHKERIKLPEFHFCSLQDPRPSSNSSARTKRIFVSALMSSKKQHHDHLHSSRTKSKSRKKVLNDSLENHVIKKLPEDIEQKEEGKEDKEDEQKEDEQEREEKVEKESNNDNGNDDDNIENENEDDDDTGVDNDEASFNSEMSQIGIENSMIHEDPNIGIEFELNAIKSIANADLIKDEIERNEGRFDLNSEEYKMVSTRIAMIYDKTAMRYFNKGNYDIAETFFTKAIEMNNTVASYFANRGKIRMIKEKFQDAKDDLQISVSLDPSKPNVQYLLNQLTSIKPSSSSSTSSSPSSSTSLKTPRISFKNGSKSERQEYWDVNKSTISS